MAQPIKMVKLGVPIKWIDKEMLFIPSGMTVMQHTVTVSLRVVVDKEIINPVYSPSDIKEQPTILVQQTIQHLVVETRVNTGVLLLQTVMATISMAKAPMDSVHKLTYACAMKNLALVRAPGVHHHNVILRVDVVLKKPKLIQPVYSHSDIREKPTILVQQTIQHLVVETMVNTGVLLLQTVMTTILMGKASMDSVH